MNDFGTLTPVSPLIPESRHVMDSSFNAGEVVTVDFTGIVGSGWLSIGNADGDFGKPFLRTDTTPSTLTHTFDGTETGGQVLVIAATAEVRCGPQMTIEDLDRDGVVDDEDACADTDLDGDVAPKRQLRHRLWADSDGTFVFGDGTASGSTIAETAGCSASQIIDASGLGEGHTKFGISKGAFAAFLASQDTPGQTRTTGGGSQVPSSAAGSGQ